jgi:hypothetical protein
MRKPMGRESPEEVPKPGVGGRVHGGWPGSPDVKVQPPCLGHSDEIGKIGRN